MQSLPVQFAGATAGTPPAALGLAGTASADDSFASAFGQALADAPDYVPNGSSMPSKAQNEQSNAGNSDAASMALTFLNCFVANLVQPTPTVAPSGEAGTTQVNSAVSTTAPTSDSPPEADTSPSSPAVLTGAISGASAALGDQQNVGALAPLPQPDSGLSSPTVATGSGISARTAPGDEPISADPASPNHADEGLCNSTEATGADSSAPATSRDAQSTAATEVPPQMDEGVAGPVVTAGTGASIPAAPPPVQSAAAPITFASAAHHDTQTTAAAPLQGGDRATRFAAGHARTAGKTEAARSRKDTVASSAAHGGGETTAQSTGLVAAQNSPQVFANSPTIATTAEVQNPRSQTVVASSPLPQSGGAEGDSLPVRAASIAPAQMSGTQRGAAIRPDSGSWSGLWRHDAAPAQASFPAASQYVGQTSGSVPSAGQTGQESFAAEPAARHYTATTTATDSSVAPFANGSTAVSSTNDSSTAPSANDSTEPAGVSDPLTGFADEGLTITSVAANVTGAAPVAQDVQAAAPAAGSNIASAHDEVLPGATTASTVAEKLAGAAVTMKVFGNESSPVSGTAVPAAKSAPAAVGAPREGPQQVAVVPVAAAKTGNSTGTEAKREHFSAADRTLGEPETVGQNVNDSPAPSIVEIPSAASITIPTPSIPGSHQATVSADVPQRTKEVTSVQDGSAAPVSQSGSSSNLPEASSNGQGKSGQQSGSRSGDKPAAPVFSPAAGSTAVSDSAVNLVAAHTASAPAGHTVTTAPQTPASNTQPAATLAAWQNYEGGPGKIVRSASLTDSPSGAEMHVELRAGNLGPLEIRTVVREGSVGAEIHVQGQEAHTLLSAGLPSLERALGERNLRVESIAVYQDQTGAGTSGGEQRGQQSGSSPSPPRQSFSWDNPPQADTAATRSTEDDDSANPVAGLSVRA